MLVDVDGLTPEVRRLALSLTISSSLRYL